MTTVYVKLLDEGTPVFRPVQAEVLDNLTARLLPIRDYDKNEEEWEFPPGAIVKCEHRIMEGKNVLVAVANSQL
jgi:hypothetical protein